MSQLNEKLELAIVETKDLPLEERIKILEEVVKGLATAVIYLWHANGGDVGVPEVSAGPES